MELPVGKTGIHFGIDGKSPEYVELPVGKVGNVWNVVETMITFIS